MSQGLNFKFIDIQAVIGVEQMKKIDIRVQEKKKIFKTYQEQLKDTPQVQFIKPNLECCTSWFRNILPPDKQTRDCVAVLLNEYGINTRPFYPVIHQQPPNSWVKGNYKNQFPFRNLAYGCRPRHSFRMKI